MVSGVSQYEFLEGYVYFYHSVCIYVCACESLDLATCGLNYYFFLYTLTAAQVALQRPLKLLKPYI